MQPQVLSSGRYIYDTVWISSHISSLRMRAESILETLIFSLFNQMWLVAQEGFITFVYGYACGHRPPLIVHSSDTFHCSHTEFSALSLVQYLAKM
jgi:hypothetical protein